MIGESANENWNDVSKAKSRRGAGEHTTCTMRGGSKKQQEGRSR